MDNIKMIIRISVFCTVILITRLNAQADCSSKVDVVYIKDSVVPVKEQALQLNCIVNNFKDSSHISLTRSDLPATEQIAKCITSLCLPMDVKWRQRYTVSSNNSGVYFQIKSLNRSEDDNKWLCTNPCGGNKSLQFTVHTVPQLLQFDNPPSQDEDLVQNTITLKCSTGCAYPQPSFTWFYNKIGDSRQEWSTSGFVSNKVGGCTDSERIYTSSLSLQRYTTLPDNAEKTVKFSCGITAFPGLTQSLYTSSNVNVRFAVYATTSTITGHTTEKRVVFENDTVTLECISSITRPVALVTWKKGSNNLTNIVNTVTNHDRGLASIKSTVTVTLNRNDNNIHITCETSIPGQENKASAQQGITVYWPPSTPSIPTTNLPFLEGQRDKSIYCQANEYGNPTATALWSSKYGTPDSSDSRQLIFPVLSFQQDGTPASCQLKNQFTERKSIVKQSPSIKIAVEYSPVVNILEGNNEVRTIMKHEGQRISILCNAIGNPDPTVNWNGQTPNDEYLIVGDLDRTDNGTYTCKASAISTSYPQHNFTTEKKLDVVVNYAPVVTVELSNTDPEEGTSLLISCKATGQPKTYTYTSMYQTLGTVNIQDRHLSADGILNIRNLKIEDSGTYTCLLNNGIADRNNKLDQSGNVTVLIKASPKVLLEDTTYTGAIGKSVYISAPIYSYPDLRNVEFRFQNGTQITNSSKYGVSYKKNIVKYSFYGTPVELEGYIAVLQIIDEEESDFMNYTLILDNGIGSPTKWILKHISENEVSITSFFIDGHRGQAHVTVDENDGDIRFTCEVDSNPSSTVKLLFKGEVIKEKSNTKFISMILSSVACLDSGEYKCERNNQYGQSTMKSITLFVNCSPRPLHQIRQHITSALQDPVTLSFTALAYPHPGTKGFAWFKENDVDWSPVLSNADLQISSSALQSNLTILNVSKSDYGRYRLIVTNNHGKFVQYVFLEEDVTENAGNRTKETENAALITGLSLGVVVIVLAIYAASITILYKRKTDSKDKQVDVKESTQKTYVNVAYKPNVHGNVNNDGTTEAEGDEARQYTDLVVGYSRDDRTTYEVLKDL